MGAEDEEITIDLELNDALTGSARNAAAAMHELADETRKASRALLLLDRRADKAANSLMRLAAAARAAAASQGQLVTQTGTLNQGLKQQVLNTNSASKSHKRLGSQLDATRKSMKLLTKAFSVFGRVALTAGKALAVVSAGLALIGAGAAVVGAVQGILAVAGALSSLLAFSALIPGVIGAFVAIGATGAVAFKGLGAAISAVATGDMKAFNKALKDLAPEMQKFVKSLVPAFKDYKGLTKQVQNDFARALGDAIPGAIARMQPIVRKGMRSIATEMGNFFTNIGKYFDSSAGEGLFKNFFAAGLTLMKQLSASIGPFLNGFGKIVDAAMPSLNRFFEAFGTGMRRFSVWMAGISENGQLVAWLNTAFEVASLLGSILGDVMGLIGGIVKAAGSGVGVLSGLSVALQELNTWANSIAGQTALKSFFSSIGAILQSVVPLFKVLADIVMNTLAPALATIVTNIAPGVTVFFAALAAALQMIAPYVGPIATAFSNLLIALTPLLPVIGQLAATLLSGIATVMPIVTPLIQMFAQAISTFLLPFLSALMSIFQTISPYLTIFMQTFMTVAQTLAPLLQQLGTMLQEYFITHLAQIQAFLPQILPQIVELATLLGTALVNGITMLAPHFPVIIQFFAAFLQVAIALIPIILQVATAFLRIVIAIQPVISIIITVIATVASLAAMFISGMARIVGAVAGMASAVAGAVARVAGFIGRLIGLAAQLANPFVSAASRIAGAFSSIAGAVGSVVSAVGRAIGAAQRLASIDVNPFRFAGGDVQAGQKYTVGEIGREMFVGNNGKTEIIGQGGIQEWSSNQSGFILPHFVVDAMEKVQDKFNDALAGSTGGHSELGALAEAIAARPSGGNRYDVSVIIKGDVSKEVNIKRAVKQAIAEIEADRDERK